jgi:hypothetical protein
MIIAPGISEVNLVDRGPGVGTKRLFVVCSRDLNSGCGCFTFTLQAAVPSTIDKVECMSALLADDNPDG